MNTTQFTTLSVVMPNYNDASHIVEAIEAIMDQSFRPMEVIVVDDGSTDNSLEILEKCKNKFPDIFILRNKQNIGPILSQNKAIKKTSGKYIYLASANDKILPGFFEKSVALLEKYPQAGLCFSDAVCSDNPAIYERNNLSYKSVYIAPHDVLNLLKKKHYFLLGGNAALIRRSALLNAGGLAPELKWLADCFALHVIGFRHGICYIPETLASFRYCGYSTSNRKQPDQREVIKHMLRLLKTSAYSDIFPLFKDTGIILSNTSQSLRVLLSCPEHWHYITPILIRRTLWYEIKDRVRIITPTLCKEMYKHICERYNRTAIT